MRPLSSFKELDYIYQKVRNCGILGILNMYGDSFMFSFRGRS